MEVFSTLMPRSSENKSCMRVDSIARGFNRIDMVMIFDQACRTAKSYIRTDALRLTIQNRSTIPSSRYISSSALMRLLPRMLA
jgi:hypothetical protein